MARNPYVHRRLEEWARWLAGLRSSGLGMASADMAAERVDGEGYDAPTPNVTIDIEAERTDKAVRSLIDELRQAVVAVYQRTGTYQQAAVRLGLSERSVHERLERADRRISVWLSDDEAARRLQRERNEALQRSVRP